MKKLLVLIFTIALFVSCSKNDDGTIKGTASAQGGTVVANITVKLYSSESVIIKDTKTDSEGKFSFTGVASGNYYIGGTITIDGKIWDSGNAPQSVYVSDEIVKEVALTLTQKN